jgi:hypothetical protein
MVAPISVPVMAIELSAMTLLGNSCVPDLPSRPGREALQVFNPPGTARDQCRPDIDRVKCTTESMFAGLASRRAIYTCGFV